MVPKSFALLHGLSRGGLQRSNSWLASVISLLKPSLPSTSLNSLQSLPPRGPMTIRNTYIPFSRQFVFRELLQDTAIILPSERDGFELLVLSMQKKFNSQFRLLERELSLLFQPAALCESPNEINELLKLVSSHDDESVSLRRLMDSEKGDREFWILRRLSQLARVAGFIDVSRDQLEHAFRAKQIDRESASYFVDPKDYNVIRFWIRGIHPCSMKNSPGVAKTDQPERSRPRLLDNVFKPRELLKRLSRTKRVKPLIAGSTDDLCFTNVLMAVRGVNDQELLLKLYDSTPATRPSGRAHYTDSLPLLLPYIHFRPLTTLGRTMVAASCVTAFTCLGMVAPLAWLLMSNPELVFAWSVAASSTAGLTASVILAQFWRSRARTNAHLKDVQFNCIRNSGFHSARHLLKMAVDEELKSALLTYALLLRPTEANKPVNPVALAIRAETWISKRLAPRAHLPIETPAGTSFTGGSGPAFDIKFEPERSLQLLRRLGLVHGSKDTPHAIPVSAAAAALDTTDAELSDSSSLWVIDPVVGDEFKTNIT